MVDEIEKNEILGKMKTSGLVIQGLGLVPCFLVPFLSNFLVELLLRVLNVKIRIFSIKFKLENPKSA